MNKHSLRHCVKVLVKTVVRYTKQYLIKLGGLI